MGYRRRATVYVPKVNLLDCDVEPTDEELGLLMKSVMEDVRARAYAADQALRDALVLETAEVLQKYNIKPQQTLAS